MQPDPIMPAGLRDLADEAAADQAAPRPGDPRAKELEGFVTEWRQGTEFIVTILVDWAPSLKPVYTPERTARLGDALGAVAHKHGWSWMEWAEKYGPEIMLILVAGPLVRDTGQVLKAANEAKKAAADAAGKGNTILAPDGPAATNVAPIRPAEPPLKPNE